MPTLINLQGEPVKESAPLSADQVLLFKGDADPLDPDISWDRIARVDVEFLNFTDGRGYSIARLVRNRLRFAGDVRAVGDVLVDQLPYMARCGFTSFAMRDDQSLSVAQRSLKAYSLSYQASHPVAL